MHYRKSSILQVLAKFTFWEQDCALGYNFRKSWDFRGISQFPKISSLKSSGNSLGNSCVLLLLITMLYFTWSEMKIWNRSQQCKKLLSSKTLTSLICLWGHWCADLIFRAFSAYSSMLLIHCLGNFFPVRPVNQQRRQLEVILYFRNLLWDQGFVYQPGKSRWLWQW